MKKAILNIPLSAIVFTFLLSALIFCNACSENQERDFYQIKIYSIGDESQEQRLDEYLGKAFIPAMHRAGIPEVGVFKPREGDLAGKRIFVLIPYKAACDYARIPELLDQDAQYLEDGKDYIEATHDNPPYQRIESIQIRSFKGMPGYHVPDYTTEPSERVYELRSYQGATERLYERKVEMFNDAGEIELFVKLGFQPVFFGEVISGPDMPNLMYLTTFSDTASHVDHWNAFRDSEEWNAMKKLERYKNTVSHSDKYLLYPADYSDF